MEFARLAHALDDILAARGSLAKRDILAEVLAECDAVSLPIAARFAAGSPFPRHDERTLQVGRAALTRAALALFPALDATTWSACQRAVGDTGETLALLAAAYAPARLPAQRTLFERASGPPSVVEMADHYAAIVAAPASAKPTLLEATWRRLDATSMKYAVKIMIGGMRIGMGESLVEDAIAGAFGRPATEVRHASMISGDVGETATLAREDRLQDARFRMFHPLGFMLATPTEGPPDDMHEYLVEDKFDGIRAQLHAAAGRAELFTRGLSRAPEFPEILAAAARQDRALVLDGEIVAVRSDGGIAPFARLQRRLGRRIVDDEILRTIPVRFIAYDILWLDGARLYERPFRERRRALEALPWEAPFALSPLRPSDGPGDVDALFEAARARGNEGLMFKRADSTYHFGNRGRYWMKLKRAFATLDVVVTAAELGHGRRAGVLSDVTFAVRDHTGAPANVGKAYTGLTDAEIALMTRQLRGITYERFGSVHLVRPEIVLEVAFDGVNQSPRHKSGYALRFPRIVRWRRDKPVDEIDTVERVAELWREGGGSDDTGARAAPA